jgi:hypothetical protein
LKHSDGDDANQAPGQSGAFPPHYNPNQPRVPAGHHGGGQWTRGGFGHNDPVVRLAFDDRTDPLRRIDSPPLAPTQPPRTVPKPQLRIKLPVWGAIAAAIGALLGQKDPDQQPVLVFRANDNVRDSQGVWRVADLKNANQDDIKEICGDQIEDLQGLLDKVVKTVESEGGNLAPDSFGMRAHQLMKKEVDKLIKDLEDLDVKTEFLITRDKDGKLQIMDDKNNPKGSLRSDLGHFKGTDTVCITDYKFGDKGLEKAKIDKILKTIKELFPNVTRIFITEAKPTWSPLFKQK